MPSESPAPAGTVNINFAELRAFKDILFAVVWLSKDKKPFSDRLMVSFYRQEFHLTVGLHWIHHKYCPYI